MERLLDIAFALIVLFSIAAAALHKHSLRLESSRRRRSTVAELANRNTAIVEGLMIEIERDVVGDDDDSGPVFINHYLIYEFQPETGAATEKVRGKHHVEGAKILEPGFSLHVGRSVRVKYAVDDPSVSELMDF